MTVMGCTLKCRDKVQSFGICNYSPHYFKKKLDRVLVKIFVCVHCSGFELYTQQVGLKFLHIIPDNF